MTLIKQGAFNGGIMSSDMYGRDDTEKFQKGLKDAVNVFLRPQGGVSNRAGTLTVTGIDTSGAANDQFLIPFSFNTEQNYVLEFTDDVFRVIRDGAYVLDTSVTAAAVDGITTADPARIELNDAGDAADFPIGSLVYFLDPAGDHTLNEMVLRVTAVSSEFLTVASSDGETLDTASGDWGTVGAGATLQKVYEQAHGYDLADVPGIRFAQDADTMFLAHRLYPPANLTRTDHDAWTLEDTAFGTSMPTPLSKTATITGITQANPAVVTAVAHGLVNGDGVLISDVGGMTQINNKVLIVSNVTTNTFQLSGYDTSSGHSTYTSGGTATTPGVQYKRGPDVGLTAMTTYEYAVSAISADTSEESIPSATVTVDNDLLFKGSVNTIGIPVVAGASRYNVYRKSAGAFGYLGSTTANSFADENITPDTARGPRVGRDPFADAGDYPGVVTFYEQRVAYGSTINDPQLVEASRIDSITNFDVSFPSLPDDAFRFRLRAQQVNTVRAFIPHDVLAIMTSGAEWEIAAQGDGEYLRPDRRKLAPTSYFGSYDIEPVLLGATALFVETSGNLIRDYKMGDRSAPPGDLTILARDLFERRFITSWTYARAPHGVLWVALDDGALLSMTYVAEHDVWGWTRHQIAGTDAKVKQVVAIREGLEDSVYMVVSRTIGGNTVTLTERLAVREDLDVTKAYFVDGGYALTHGTDTSVITGLMHLRGEQVTVLVDGDVYIDDFTVDETGTLDMGEVEGRQISVGLSYDSLIETLDLNFDIQGTGSTQGTYRSASEVRIGLKNSRGVEVGTDLAKMTEPKEWEVGMVGGPIPLRTETAVLSVDGDWVRSATTFVRQRNPLPMTVTAIIPDWEFGG